MPSTEDFRKCIDCRLKNVYNIMHCEVFASLTFDVALKCMTYLKESAPEDLSNIRDGQKGASFDPTPGRQRHSKPIWNNREDYTPD